MAMKALGPDRKIAYVIDDEASAASVVCKLLTAIGVEAAGFTAPGQFLVRTRTQPPDIVIVDLALGQSDAVEVIRQLEIIQFRGAVALISGRDQVMLDEIRRIGLQHGLAMLPSLRKPFRLDELKTALAAHPETSIEAESGISDGGALPQARVSLEDALREGWLELWYQPKIDLKSLKVAGAEALVRARHPEFGIVPPAQLLPPPDDALYVPLSHFVLRRALSDWPVLAAAGLRLVVEDNATIRSLVATQLAALDYRVLEAEDAAAALEQLAQADVDLLFTDVVMPGLMNGKQLAMEAQRLFPKLKVLFTSGFAGSASLSESAKLDANDCLLKKPYGRAELAQAVRSALDQNSGFSITRSASLPS
jgi:CheY-like chemotaxis protein